MPLKVGDLAPDFELRSHRGGTVKLSDYRGKKNVVVAFHPLAFTPVCATQMVGYQAELPASWVSHAPPTPRRRIRWYSG